MALKFMKKTQVEQAEAAQNLQGEKGAAGSGGAPPSQFKSFLKKGAAAKVALDREETIAKQRADEANKAFRFRMPLREGAERLHDHVP